MKNNEESLGSILLKILGTIAVIFVLMFIFHVLRKERVEYIDTHARCAYCYEICKYDDLQALDDKLYCCDCLMYVMETAECKQCHRYYHVEDVDSDTELCVYCEAGMEPR